MKNKLHLSFYLILFLIFNLYAGEKISDKKVIICGVVKNCALSFNQISFEIEKIGKLFKNYTVIVYENNSIDESKILYQNWAKKNKHVIFLCEDLSPEFINNYTKPIGDYRTHMIARARNIVLDIASTHVFDDYDFLIMMDMDEFEHVNTDALKKIIEEPQQPWDVIYANGCYDLYSLRSNEFPLGSEILTWPFIYQNISFFGKRLNSYLKSSTWYPVDSFFGGFGIFRREAILNSRYSGKMSKEFVNKILEYKKNGFFQNEPLYKKSQLLCNLNLQKLQKSVFENIFTDELFLYTCEHINFNLSLKKNGYTNIFIDPKLTRKSKVYLNFNE